jgi:hypothetical protein
MAIHSKTKSNNGLRGVAEVRVLAENLRVIFPDGDTYTVRKNGWDRESGHYNVTLNRTNDEIKFISPPGRQEPYLVKFLDFANRVGRSDDNPGVPEPKVKPAEYKTWPDGGRSFIPESLVFTAKFLVVEKGLYRGLTIPMNDIPYLFAPYSTTGLAMIEGTKGQKAKLETFLQILGLDFVNDEIPYSANVLPWLEEKFLAAGKVLSLQLNEKGYVARDGLRAIPAYLVEGLIEEEKEPKKSKAAPKKKATTAKSKKARKS